MTRYAQIVSTGRYVPAKVITNADLDAMLGEPVGQWLAENVGVRARHVMADDELTSDLAVNAARPALERAGITPAELDLIIVATDTPDYISPGTSSVVQHKLGATQAGTFDLNNACAAWGTGLDVASKYIMTDTDYNHVLVVGAYGMSRYVDWSDKRTCTVFADGAGAVILQPSDQPGFLGGKILADGAYHDYMGVYAGGTAAITGGENTARQALSLQKRYPPDINDRHWPPLVRDLMTKIGRSVSAIDKIYFTQINLRTIEHVMRELDLPMHKTHTIMDKWGYTGSACMPMALDDAIEQGLGPRPGELVVFCSSGAGFTMTAGAFIWTVK
ncbi:MAG: 3-oxoacyl-ACP synthase III family protein [Anaerolineales bacterium]